MTEVLIKKCINQKTQDGQQTTILMGDFINPEFNFAVQPKSITFALDNKQVVAPGSIYTIEKDSNKLWTLQQEKFSPRELLGSDHNSGVLWYGKTPDIEKIEIKAQTAYQTHISHSELEGLKDEYADFMSSPLIKWEFEDGTSLLISYVDTDYMQFEELTQITDKEIVHFEFGGVTDDILAHEILNPYIFNVVKEFKHPKYEFDPEEFPDEEDYPITYGGKKKLNKEAREVIANLAYHIYCSLLQTDKMTQADNDFEEQIFALAYALKKRQVLAQLPIPEENRDYRLIFESDTSHKEYNLNLVKRNSDWIVDISYGRVGANLTKTEKVFDKLELAQLAYLDLLKEKMMKGYEIDATQLKSKYKLKV